MIRFPDDYPAVKRTIEEACAKNWEALASLAWRSYNEHGRGALVLLWEQVVGSPILHPAYATTCAEPDTANAIASYDPELSIVVVVTEELWDTGQEGLLRGKSLFEIITHEPSPKAIAQKKAN
jgi:hypothetical protein